MLQLYRIAENRRQVRGKLYVEADLSPHEFAVQKTQRQFYQLVQVGRLGRAFTFPQQLANAAYDLASPIIFFDDVRDNLLILSRSIVFRPRRSCAVSALDRIAVSG